MVWILYLKYHKILRTLALNFLMNYWLFEKVYQTLHSAFHPISRHLKVGLKKWVEGNLVWNHTRDFKSGRANKSQEYHFRPKLHVTKLNYITTLLQPFWNRRIQSVPILVWPNSRFVESGTKRLLHLILYPKQKWCNIEQKWCDLKQKWGALEHEWHDLEKRWFRPKNSVIREQITLLRANQIARITSDFKRDKFGLSFWTIWTISFNTFFFSCGVTIN